MRRCTMIRWHYSLYIIFFFFKCKVKRKFKVNVGVHIWKLWSTHTLLPCRSVLANSAFLIRYIIHFFASIQSLEWVMLWGWLIYSKGTHIFNSILIVYQGVEQSAGKLHRSINFIILFFEDSYSFFFHICITCQLSQENKSIHEIIS